MIGFEWRNSPRHVSQVRRSLAQGRNPSRLSTCPPRLPSFLAHRRCKLLPSHPFLVLFRRHVEGSQPSFPRTLRARVVLVGRSAVGLVRWSWEIRWLHAILHLGSVRFEFRRDIDGNRDETDQRIRWMEPQDSIERPGEVEPDESTGPAEDALEEHTDASGIVRWNPLERRNLHIPPSHDRGSSPCLSPDPTSSPTASSPPFSSHPSCDTLDRRVVTRRGRLVAHSLPHDLPVDRWIGFLPDRLSLSHPQSMGSNHPMTSNYRTVHSQGSSRHETLVDVRPNHPSCWNRRGGWNNDEQEVRPPRRTTKAMEDSHRKTLVDIDGGNEETWNGKTVPERTRTRGRRQTMKWIEKDANRGCNGAEENNWRAWEH